MLSMCCLLLYDRDRKHMFLFGWQVATVCQDSKTLQTIENAHLQGKEAHKPKNEWQTIYE